MFRNDIKLAIGTASFWRGNHGGLTLLTCWHNVTGTHPETGQSLSSHGGRPNRLRFYFPEQGLAGQRHTAEIALYDDDGLPIWRVHPRHRQRVDVVAIPVAGAPPPQHYLNDLPEVRLRRFVGSDVFILGHPEGIAREHLPVWKRGSLALDPDLLDDDHYLHTLVDSATRSGMSGSPVIQRQYGTILTEDSPHAHIHTGATRFFGIYSGRVSAEDQLGAHLGMIWPEAQVRTVLNEGVRDDFVG
ncbi:trypsin-like peptidase domain-containing protein [Brevundimonas sp. TWP2-1]